MKSKKGVIAIVAVAVLTVAAVVGILIKKDYGMPVSLSAR